MALPRWRRTGGLDFVFFHSHPGFEWEDVDITNEMQSLLCNDLQWAVFVAVEQGQRWRCPTYTPRSTILAPYASTEVVNLLEPRVPDEERNVLAFFRCAWAHLEPRSVCIAMEHVHQVQARLVNTQPAGRAGEVATRQLTSWASSSGNTSCSG